MNKLHLFIVGLFFIIFSPVCGAGQKVLFIAAGQSNAVGMADSSLSVAVPSGAGFEYKYKRDRLEPLKDPVGEPELNFGQAQTGSLWPSFAASYNRLSGKEVIIIPAARGGSSCDHRAELGNMGTWDSVGSMPLLAGAVKKAKGARRLVHQKIDGIIWLQGERDANAIFDHQLTPKQYEASLKSVIERFRRGMGSMIPFYIVLTGNQRGREPRGNEAVRKVQQKIAGEVPAVYIVYKDTKDFESRHLMKDFVHYNQKALNQMGKSIAQKIINLQTVNSNSKFIQ